ncbi:ImmA/IrrE family metallo-endopeptidase [Bacillus benzoevorans]|uniref:Zn-dependent peptidase ImmA (M78 family) n=1 Tax=Bacillus benzoevorans TaxID=1456 RepID=A0A7X0HW85_9BACI|nr:ImmA/IrrE family metallo-endopeptidase [Bacillus benzoevorans]MBB6446736.1 Zn-dependent peptidase ImmA (M78 family) [Bacillus benzoevorans]
MINKENIEQIILYNQKYHSIVKEKIDSLRALSDPLITSKPLEFIKTHLYENSYVLEFPINNLEYGGLVFYHHQNFYIQINTAQPKIYENFMWAHEFYHFFFDKDRIKGKEENSILIDSIFDEKERLPNLFASEFLINDFALERKFKFFKKEFDGTSLVDIVINLIAVFELPYKAIVIKLAQNNLIEIVEAKEIIDYDYKRNLPDYIDRTLFSPSNKIRIDNIDRLASVASSNMNEEDYQSIMDRYNKLYEIVLEWRKKSDGDKKYESYRRS